MRHHLPLCDAVRRELVLPRAAFSGVFGPASEPLLEWREPACVCEEAEAGGGGDAGGGSDAA